MKNIKHILIALFFSSLFLSCNSLKTAAYDQYSFQKSVEIKIDASNLIDKGTTPYTDHLKDIGELGLEIQKIIEYEKNKPNNEITYAMWQVLANKDKSLLVGFFKRWKEKKQLKPFFIKEAKKQIMDVMDLLIQYESKKDKETKDKLLKLITNN